MHSRMETDLCEEGDFLPVAWKALIKVLFECFGQWEKCSSQIYLHKLDPGAVEILFASARRQAVLQNPRQKKKIAELLLASCLY